MDECEAENDGKNNDVTPEDPMGRPHASRGPTGGCGSKGAQRQWDL